MSLNTVKISKEKLVAKGIISRQDISALIETNNGLGIRFIIKKPELSEDQVIEANIKNLFSTQRNTVIANEKQECVCLTEHFLAAAALTNANNIDCIIDEAELPFADGAAMFWVDFLKLNGFANENISAFRDLETEVSFFDDNDDSKYITLKPADSFSVCYKMDWDHPLIGKQEFTWKSGETAIEDIARARTFSNETENQLLGLSGWVVGFTDEKFTSELYFDNEPARHKALDLVGDMMLSGINPLEVKMQVISHKGGHELNSKVAKFLSEYFN